MQLALTTGNGIGIACHWEFQVRTWVGAGFLKAVKKVRSVNCQFVSLLFIRSFLVFHSLVVSFAFGWPTRLGKNGTRTPGISTHVIREKDTLVRHV